MSVFVDVCVSLICRYSEWILFHEAWSGYFFVKQVKQQQGTKSKIAHGKKMNKRIEQFLSFELSVLGKKKDTYSEGFEQAQVATTE